jgi:DnaK suppressor protein
MVVLLVRAGGGPAVVLLPRGYRSRGYDADMDPTSLELARASLLEERERLLAEQRETAITAPDPMTYGSQAAAASQVFAQQRDLALRDHNQVLIESVDAALARIGAGTYGICVTCGLPIAPERLEALPAAAHCIECQRKAQAGRRR